MGIFYSAFLQKNHLFPPPELARENTEEEDAEDIDLERLAKIEAIMDGIECHTRHKAIEGHQ